MDVLYSVWLSTCKYVGPVFQKKLISHFKSSQAVYFADESELSSVPGINKRAVSSLIHSRSLLAAKKIVENARQREISILRYDDHLYPVFVKECRESPIVLYYKGRLNSLHFAAGVVGSRRCSPYGRDMAKEIGSALAKLQIPVVSGFARGIDTYAHEGCLDSSGYPIAFLAGGVDVCYPNEQLILYKKILNSGGVFLSQYPPGTPPTAKRFLQRNALISAWSTEVIVVEAGENSGALWTADFAMKQGKNVYAVPNRINQIEGIGTNLLLAEGARPFLHINCLELVQNSFQTLDVLLPPKPENPLLRLLEDSPKSIAALLHLTMSTEATLLDKLLELELQGSIIIRGNLVIKR